MIDKTEKHANFLEDNSLNKSSKRLWGSALIAIGIVLGVILFILSIKVIIADSETARKMVEFFLYTGGGLLGLGIVDNIFRR